MAEQHIQAVLTAAGIAATDFEALKALPADAADFKPDEYVGKVRTAVETALKNDPNFWNSLDENNVNETFKKKIQDQQYGRAANIVRQKMLAGLGLTEEDFKDLPEDDKKRLETFAAKATERFVTTKAGDKEMQKDLLATRKKLEELEASLPEKETQYKTQYETQFQNQVIDYIVLAELATIEGLKAPANYIADKIAAELKSEYTLKVNGMRAEPFQKSNPNLKVVEGSKELGLKDLINKILTRDQLIGEKQSDPSDEKGKTKIRVEGEDNKLKVSSHVQAAIDEANK